MAKTANLNIRIEPEIKAQAEELFANFGLTVTQAVNIFLHISLLHGGFPFDIQMPKDDSEIDLFDE